MSQLWNVIWICRFMFSEMTQKCRCSKCVIFYAYPSIHSVWCFLPIMNRTEHRLHYVHHRFCMEQAYETYSNALMACMRNISDTFWTQHQHPWPYAMWTDHWCGAVESGEVEPNHFPCDITFRTNYDELLCFIFSLRRKLFPIQRKKNFI